MGKVLNFIPVKLVNSFFPDVSHDPTLQVSDSLKKRLINLTVRHEAMSNILIEIERQMDVVHEEILSELMAVPPPEGAA